MHLPAGSYSGPAYQPINEFLRACSGLPKRYRDVLARHPSLTFAATVGHIRAAIRKLAAVATDEEVSQPLYRGVSGVLQKDFFTMDKQGMVIAAEPGFMSTSREIETPLKYMDRDQGGDHVLWELSPKQESSWGYHHGADISLLSQFSKEKEILFPPCTMLEVTVAAKGASHQLKRTVSTAAELTVPAVPESPQVSGKTVSRTTTTAAGEEVTVKYVLVKARPCFV